MVLSSHSALADSPVVIDYVQSIPTGTYIVDARSKSECLSSSYAGAHCLPIETLLPSHQRLANFSGLLWKLGAIGLKGSEHILVVGQSTMRKDFLAGVLYLAGQRRISVLNPSVPNKLTDKPSESLTTGTAASTTRKVVWQNLMRSDKIVLHNDMKEIVAAGDMLILDGRTDAEYWAQKIRAHRGGHIPGADLSSYSDWVDTSNIPVTNTSGSSPIAIAQPLVAYAADTYSGIAYIARIVAAGVNARLYIDGWVRWASDTALAVDAASYPGKGESLRTQTAQQTESENAIGQDYPKRHMPVGIWLISVALAFLCGYIASSVYRRKS